MHLPSGGLVSELEECIFHMSFDISHLSLQELIQKMTTDTTEVRPQKTSLTADRRVRINDK
jgi:hypothetical protein